jgi:hypothetical protein
MRHRAMIWGTAMVVAGTVGVPPAGAQSQTPRQTYSERFTTDQPGALTGRAYAIDWVNPADPHGKPPSFSHLRVELAAGARFDTSALPQCRASDAELMVAGPSACPRDSVVANDETLIDTGFPGPGRHVTSDLVFFNNRNELVLLATIRENGTRVVLRAQVGVNTIDLDVPPLPGTPPDGGAAKRQRGTFYPRSTVRDRTQVNYLTTPRTCPSSGFWVNTVTYTYRDGVTQTAHSRSPCQRPPGSRAAPQLRVSIRPRTARAGRRTHFVITVTGSADRRAVAGARIRFAGKSAFTDGRGRAVIHQTISSAGRWRARAWRRSFLSNHADVQVLPRGR